MPEANFVYLTKERLVELEKELQELKTNGRKEIAAKIAEAQSAYRPVNGMLAVILLNPWNSIRMLQ